MELKKIDITRPLEAYDEVLDAVKRAGREPNTADRMLAMRAAIAAYEEDKEQANVLPPFAAPASQQEASESGLTDAMAWEVAAHLLGTVQYVGRDAPFVKIESPADAGELARAFRDELTRRFRAQGGDTSQKEPDNG